MCAPCGRRCAAWAFPTAASSSPVAAPACFFSLLPEALADKTTLTGVELDPDHGADHKTPLSERPNPQRGLHQGAPADDFDLVIGNPPFSDRTVRGDDPVGALNLSLHDYFIARSIERLRPGGLAAFVTSRWTMDKTDSKARAFIASMADLRRRRPPAGRRHARRRPEPTSWSTC